MHNRLKNLIDSGIVGHLIANTPVSHIFVQTLDGLVTKYEIVPKVINEQRLTENVVSLLSYSIPQKITPAETDFQVKYEIFGRNRSIG